MPFTREEIKLLNRSMNTIQRLWDKVERYHKKRNQQEVIEFQKECESVDKDREYTFMEISKETGLSYPKIYQLYKKGFIQATKKGGRLYVTEEARSNFEAWATNGLEGPGPANPPKEL